MCRSCFTYSTSFRSFGINFRLESRLTFRFRRLRRKFSDLRRFFLWFYRRFRRWNFWWNFWIFRSIFANYRFTNSYLLISRRSSRRFWMRSFFWQFRLGFFLLFNFGSLDNFFFHNWWWGFMRWWSWVRNWFNWRRLLFRRSLRTNLWFFQDFRFFFYNWRLRNWFWFLLNYDWLRLRDFLWFFMNRFRNFFRFWGNYNWLWNFLRFFMNSFRFLLNYDWLWLRNFL